MANLVMRITSETYQGIKMIDYTYPLLMAQQELKALYEAMQNHDHEAALKHAYAALAETKLTCSVIKEMVDQRKHY